MDEFVKKNHFWNLPAELYIRKTIYGIMSKNILESSFNGIIDRIKHKDSHVFYDISSLPVFLLVYLMFYVMIMTILFFVIYYNMFLIFALSISIMTIIYMLMRHRKMFNCIILFVLAYLIIKTLFYLGSINTDDDSARYLISALIQSEAAILAIVVSLSLVAVQQTSSSYSTRVISVFKNPKTNPDFFVLMGIYIFAIIYGSWVLRQISPDSSLGIHIWTVYLLSIFALLALVPYIRNTLEMFDPTKIIQLLSKDMRFSKINNAINLEKNGNVDNNGQIQPVNDSIQPIVDVLQSSIEKHDYETTKYGLKIIEKKMHDILTDNYKPEIASRFISHVETIGIKAANQQMEKTTEHVASILGQFGTFEITDDINYISSLQKIGKIAAEQKNEDATNTVISSLKNAAKTATDNKLENDARKVMTSIKEIGLSNITSNHISYFVLYSVINSLEDIITKVAKKWGKEWEKDIWHGIFALQDIGFKLIEDKNVSEGDKRSLGSLIVSTIFSITEITINLDLKRATYYAYMSVKNIGMLAADDNIVIAKDARFTFNNIYLIAIDNYGSMDDELSIKFIRQIKDNIEELDNYIETKQRNAPPE